MKLQEMSDKDLYKFCQDIGKNSRKWMRQFAFALPEVARRGLHRRRGFRSINEFAAKLAGMSREVSEEVLRLGEKFKELPRVWAQIKNHGWTKLRVIASVVNFENQELWLENLENPKGVLEEVVREYKFRQMSQMETGQLSKNVEGEAASEITPEFPGEAGGNTSKRLSEAKIADLNIFGESDPSQKPDLSMEQNEYGSEQMTYLRLKINKKTNFEFRNFQKNLEKEKKQVVTMGEALLDLLENMKRLNQEVEELRKFKNKKLKIQQKSSKKQHTQTKNSTACSAAKQPSRYYSVKIEQEMFEKYQGRCAAPNCNKPFTARHHPNRLSLDHTHKNIVPLCHLHHQMVHAGLIENENQEPEQWKIRLNRVEGENSKKEQIDKKVRVYWT